MDDPSPINGTRRGRGRPRKLGLQETHDLSSSDFDNINIAGPSSSEGGNIQKRGRGRPKKRVFKETSDSSSSDCDDSAFSYDDSSSSPESFGSLEEMELEDIVESPSTAMPERNDAAVSSSES